MSTSEDCPPWELLDAFCGGGLASSGFRAAGMRLVGAVDSSPEALSVYKLNFATRVSCATLGPSLEEYQFPAPRPQLHVHLSPPCTELSNAKSGPRSGQGMELLAWSVETAVCYESFSIETVHTSQTLAFARDATERQPEHIAWGVYDAVNFGAAQTRVRLVIATPAIIRRLNEAPAAVRLSIDDAFRAAGATIPAGSTHVKNSSAVVDGTNIRPLQVPLSHAAPLGRSASARLLVRPPFQCVPSTHACSWGCLLASLSPASNGLISACWETGSCLGSLAQ